jgi:hypothetical protein
MRRRAATLLGAALALLPPSARAADAPADDAEDECHGAQTAGTFWRDEGRLVRAKNSFYLCSRSACPATKEACKTALEDVEDRLPSVVLRATDVDGKDAIETNVKIDLWLEVRGLDGHAEQLDPGTHTFWFEGPRGATAQETVRLKAGEKNRLVLVVLTGGAAPTARPPSRPVALTPWILVGAGALSLLAGIPLAFTEARVLTSTLVLGGFTSLVVGSAWAALDFDARNAPPLKSTSAVLSVGGRF